MATNQATATFELHTDGACLGNPGGPGGWGAVLTSAGQASWYAGHHPRTTNNRMELLAAIKGLDQTPAGSRVTVISDSQYLVHTMTRGWQRRANLDLWERLDTLVKGRSVTWQWVPGHSGYPLNEEADRLATSAAADPRYGEQSGPLLPASSPDGTATARVETAPLSHLDEEGHARMVDVSAKEDTEREAVAKAVVHMGADILALIQSGGVPKGDVFTVAQVAGVMAAKRTSDLIPMCHPLGLTHIQVTFRPDEARSCVEVTAQVRTRGKTGVEMEALTATAVAALTVYDMCKAADRSIRITDLRLIEKSGGKSGPFRQE